MNPIQVCHSWGCKEKKKKNKVAFGNGAWGVLCGRNRRIDQRRYRCVSGRLIKRGWRGSGLPAEMRGSFVKNVDGSSSLQNLMTMLPWLPV